MSKKVTVITPTTGTKYLEKCIASVREQTYDNYKHFIVVDGNQYWDKVKDIVAPYTDDENIECLWLYGNTGANGYNGHRIYGSAPYLINTDYVCFLDEDNWVEPNHLKSLMDIVRHYDWAFSLRKIIDSEGRYICNDDCESLGLWPTCLSDREFFVDVGCYCLPLSIALQTSPIWYRRARHPEEQPEVDRLLMQVLLQHKFTHQTTGEYTLNYRVGNRPDSVKAEFFLQGNKIMEQKYETKFPWRKV